MIEPQQQTLRAEEDATLVSVPDEEQTLVAPRFDDEETLVARPVVPLEAVAGEAPDGGPAAQASAPAAHAYAPARRSTRRPWPLTLMLVSVLIGGVLGGAGLYLYQRQTGDVAVTPAAQTSDTAASAEGAQPAAAAAPTPEVPTEAPAADAQAREESPAPDAAPPAATEPDAAANEPAPEAGSVPASERREARGDDSGGNSGPRKRGKKGEHDEEIQRARPAGRRADSEDLRPRAGADPREARRVDTIIYRPRRANSRERVRRDTAGDVDRLRRIFEGSPQ